MVVYTDQTDQTDWTDSKPATPSDNPEFRINVLESDNRAVPYVFILQLYVRVQQLLLPNAHRPSSEIDDVVLVANTVRI